MSVEISEVLDNLGYRYAKTPTHYILHSCPVCNGKNKLYIDKEKLLWICFKCRDISGEGTGNAWKLLHLLGYSNTEISAILKEGGNPVYYSEDFEMELIESARDDIDIEEEIPIILMPSHFIQLDCSVQDFKYYPEAYNYILSRRISSFSLIKKYNLMYSPLLKRIIMPFYDENARLVGWQGRDITDRWKSKHHRCPNNSCSLKNTWYFNGESVVPPSCPECGGILELNTYPKTLNSSHFNKQKVLVNSHRIDWDRPVVLVEGPFDSINTPNSIPLLGKFLSHTQFKKIIAKAKQVYLYFDGDEAGTQSTISVYRQLEMFLSVSIIHCPDDKDPGQFSYSENLEKLNNPISIEEWGPLKNLIV